MPPEPGSPDLTETAELAALCVLALDVGEARIGVAVKPAGQSMALPLTVVAARPESEAFACIRRLIEDRRVRIVVVGLPLHDDPTQSTRVKRTVRRLRRGVEGVVWRFCDETLTSAAAAEFGRELGEGRKARPDDDRAAALILETWLHSGAAASPPESRDPAPPAPS